MTAKLNMQNHLAFVFPGQGSQSVGMLAELAAAYPIIKETYDEASKALDYDLWHLTQQGPEELLNQTEKTQPALLAASVAIWRIWQIEKAPLPSLLAGHSLGEYSALVCAEALDFIPAIKLVAKRGCLMQEAVPEGQGAMAAIIGLSDAEVVTLCQKAAENEIVSAANFNAVGQVVVAGNKGAVERVVALAKPAGAKMAKLLNVSVPSHCALMKPAAERFAAYLNEIDIRTPKIPVIHNADLSSYSAPHDIREALKKQLYLPVRWVESMQLFSTKGIKLAIESGPGKILAGLNKRITDDFTTLTVLNPDQLQQALKEVETCC